MKKILWQLWQDDGGAVHSGELLLISTILVLGVIPGIVALRNGIVVEMTEMANAIVAMSENGSTCEAPVCTEATSSQNIDVVLPCD